MEIAFCTKDKKEYLAKDFDQLPAKEIENKRRYFICMGCEKNAFFRTKAISGQAACFGSRNHADNCSFSTQDPSRIITTSEEQKLINAFINDGNDLEIRFGDSNEHNYPISFIVTEDISSIKQTSIKHSSNMGIKKSKSSKNLNSILKIIMHDKEKQFVNSNMRIHIPGRNYAYYAKNIFSSFDDINETQINQYKFIYGEIMSIEYRKDKKNIKELIWINFSENYFHEEISIKINENDLNEFNSKFFNKETAASNIGKYVLAGGYINLSQNNKLYMNINDLNYICFEK